MRKPIDTRKCSPEGFLLDVMVHGPSATIERQESMGQSSFVGSDTLPTRFLYSAKEDLESMGVKFLGPVEGDELFQYVQLPEGWQKKATSHSMWSELLDAEGKKVASIFYKAAFYDRAAHICVEKGK